MLRRWPRRGSCLLRPDAHPVSARGARTRGALVRAAREVFERDGFLEARITDITAAAGVAAGSFYTYFTSKEDAFAAVMSEIEEEMLHPRLEPVHDRDDPVAVIEASNRAYLVAYRRNAKLMGLMEQVARDRSGVSRAAAPARASVHEAQRRRDPPASGRRPTPIPSSMPTSLPRR